MPDLKKIAASVLRIEKAMRLKYDLFAAEMADMEKRLAAQARCPHPPGQRHHYHGQYESGWECQVCGLIR